MNYRKLIISKIRLLVVFILVSGCSSEKVIGSSEKEYEPEPEYFEKVVIGFNSVTKNKFVNNYQLYRENWDTLGQARFWQQIISLSHDSMIMNIASVRQPLHKISLNDWHCQSPEEKALYKENLCISNNLNVSTGINVTSGKKFFFEFRKALPMISESIGVFEALGTDPWFAQTILLIESPGKTEAVSYVGARGPFQLMPYVARKYGLVVSKTRDDRTNLEKSATAAAKFIGGVCIPSARKILDGHSITYNETDLWFRLFVMHVYHAGAGNVAAVVNKISPERGGMELIRTMWQTEAAGFKNESQNYSQVALGSIITFDRLIDRTMDTVYLVQGDKNMKLYLQKNVICVDTIAYLTDCIAEYESDLVDGMIPFDYFLKSINNVKDEIRRFYKNKGLISENDHFADSERMFRLGNQLMTKRKYQDAVLAFHAGLKYNPVAPAVYDSLGKSYRMLGNNDLALKYSRKSKEIIKNPETVIK